MVLRRKRDLLLTALEGALKETCIWSRPTGGLFLWLRLPEDVDWVALKALTAARGFYYAEGEDYRVEGKAVHFIRLAFGHVPMLRLPKASPCWPDVLLGAGSVMRAVSLRVCLMINGVALQRLEPF
jgi:DNA-binding transcriptional MocR family regulator